MRIRIAETVLIGTILGLAAGVGIFTFVYAKGSSYLTNDPEACANCHVMQPYYDGWLKSSHRTVAACNDCHTPHDLLPKYATKFSNGFHHSYAFTSGRFEDAMRIKEHNLEVTEHACRNCHEPVVEAIDAHAAGGEGISCVRCHPGVGHPR